MAEQRENTEGTRVDARTSTGRQVYERSLKELRQDIGCTPERLMDHPELLAALRQGLVSRTASATVEECVRELERLVASLGDPKHRDALLVALRFHPGYRDSLLTTRRGRYNEDLALSTDPETRLHHVVSTRSLERRENDAIEDVVKFLLADRGRAQGHSPNERHVRRAGEPGAKLVTESAVFTYFLSATGVLTRMEVRIWARALGPDADPRWDFEHKYFSESRRGVLSVEPIVGCEVLHQSEAETGGLLVTLQIHKRLSPSDGVYSFGHTVLVDSERRCHPVLHWSPLSEHARRLEFQVRFDAAMTPVRAWWFRAQMDTQGQIPPHPGEGRQLELLDGGRYLYKVFEADPLQAHLFHGVAWQWPGA